MLPPPFVDVSVGRAWRWAVTLAASSAAQEAG